MHGLTFTVKQAMDPNTGGTGVAITANDETKRWASTGKESANGRTTHGRAQTLGFIVDLLKQYQNDRPVYRGVRLEAWERELEGHEHTTESVASTFRDLLRANFTKESIVVAFDPTEVEYESPKLRGATEHETRTEMRRLALLVSGRSGMSWFGGVS